MVALADLEGAGCFGKGDPLLNGEADHALHGKFGNRGHEGSESDSRCFDGCDAGSSGVFVLRHSGYACETGQEFDCRAHAFGPTVSIEHGTDAAEFSYGIDESGAVRDGVGTEDIVGPTENEQITVLPPPCRRSGWLSGPRRGR